MIPLQFISRSEHRSSELAVKARPPRKRSRELAVSLACDRWFGRFDDDELRRALDCPSVTKGQHHE
jgi:hypothetical protein